MFYTLVELSESLTITPENAIELEMKLNAANLKKKVFRLQLEKAEVDEHHKVQMAVEKVRRELRGEFGEGEGKITALSKTVVLQGKTL